MKNITAEFGEYLTVISGLNGTGKSTLLGLVGHIFSFRGETQKFDHLALDKKPFETEYSEIFRFCPQHDENKIHEYTAIISDGGDLIEKDAKSRYSVTEKRFRIDVGERKGRKGKLHLPVIYLGLRRLFPLAQEKEEEIHVDVSDLDENYKEFFKAESSVIFVSLEKTTDVRHVSTPNKDSISIETETYGALGNSAGQDNIGQILTALLSFKKLNPGHGILLIDEIDTALFAGAQINLIKRLYKFSRVNKIQVIFTTHSLDLIEFILSKKSSWEGITVNFLELENKLTKVSINPNFEYIKYKTLMEAKEESEIKRLPILCEDKMGALWCKNLLSGTDMKCRLKVYPSSIPKGSLALLAKRKLKPLKDFIFVLDGDAISEFNTSIPKNVVFLPGSTNPETILYKFCSNLSGDDCLWRNSKNYFDKIACFNGFVDKKESSTHKKWIDARANNFGKGYANLLNSWRKHEDNLVMVSEFRDKIRLAIEKSGT